MESQQKESDTIIYYRLRRNYLTIYLLACLVDWLQGPYLYSIYLNLNYTRSEIGLFYVIGFVSSGLFGLVVGDFADKFGRKKLCIVYFLLTIMTCLCTVSGVGGILIIGRIFGGVSTSILFSAFESWYISEHLLHYKLDKKYLASTFTQSSLYNGFIAIFGGFISSFLVDAMNYGPSAPFLFSIPISLVSAFLCYNFWTENNNSMKIVSIKTNERETACDNIVRGLRIIIFSQDKSLLLLGVVQIAFETVMYIFVFLWTPVLEPIQPSYGYIFGILMICIVIGSSLYSTLVNTMKISVQVLLCISIILALFSISMCTVGVYLQMKNENLPFGTYLCLVCFLFFECSVGMYLPAMSYLRGVIIPENFRANVTNWLRLPANILIIIFLLFYVRIENNGNQLIFTLSAATLSIAAFSSFEFIKVFSSKSLNRNTNDNSNTGGCFGCSRCSSCITSNIFYA